MYRQEKEFERLSVDIPRQTMANWVIRCELSNNRAERSIKSFVIGRKNSLFSDTVHGAKSSAIIYSIIETAKKNAECRF
ncbi:MAG: transposase [Clostridium sp.]|nr:transposase [Clostridium sp.]